MCSALMATWKHTLSLRHNDGRRLCGEQTAPGTRAGLRLTQLEKARDIYVSCDVCSFDTPPYQGSVRRDSGEWRLAYVGPHAKICTS